MSVDTEPTAPARAARRTPVRPDAVCAAAVDLARSAAQEGAEPGSVGDPLQVQAAGERLVTHLFDCTLKGYRGWRWAVSLARAPRAKTATVCEVELVAGPDAVQAPVHVPWEERLRPGDMGADDVLARVEDDPRLVWGFEATGDEDVDAVALDELGLGRRRVLSGPGRAEAADRWHAGEFGPEQNGPKPVEESCASCGFMLPITGPLREVFAVCANEWSPADGRLVTLDYGCGAHSETDVPVAAEATVEPVVDDFALDAEPTGDETAAEPSDVDPSRPADDLSPAEGSPPVDDSVGSGDSGEPADAAPSGDPVEPDGLGESDDSVASASGTEPVLPVDPSR